MIIKNIISFFIDLVFIKKCLICENKHGEYLCKTCFRKLKFKGQSCPKCKKNNKYGKLCKECREHFNYKGIMVAGDFKDKNLSKLIKIFKFNFIEKIGEYLGIFLLNFFKNLSFQNPIFKNNLDKKEDYFNKKNTILVFVPISKRRFNWRGFNQSEILAKIISSKTKIPIFYGLKRKKHKTAQAKLKREERKSNLKNCFSVINKKESLKAIKNKKIIIIDDVFTTGATIEELSREIKKYQALEIWGLVLARA